MLVSVHSFRFVLSRRVFSSKSMQWGRLSLLCGLISLTASAFGAEGKVSFRREVLPILSDACFRCHGPDEPKREAKLRLDTKEGLFRTQDGVTVVRPGKPDESALVQRILSRDHDKVMPPKNAVRQLTAAEMATLQRWVAEGAPWEGHWAFAAIQKPMPPPVKGKTVSPIDAFVIDRLQREQWALSPEADRERLLRRVTLDLTGLPPTPAEREAFLADASPDAYERVVERLLASPRYGERMATDWLDLARFADTHGYQLDRPRAMWAWRDWVIQSFNRNQRFDQFVTEQLAGDLLPSPTKAQRLATGFNRLHNQNEEGGIVEEEYRQAYVADRVTTFGTAFLGLTLDCARCHDHKYDPITQKDFFSLAAFFQNIDEAGQITYKGFADSMPVPTMLLTTDEQDRELEALQHKTEAAEKAVATARAAAGQDFAGWLARRGEYPAQLPGLVARYTFDTMADDKVTNAVSEGPAGVAVESPVLRDDPSRGKVVELSGENGFKFPQVGHFRRTDPFSLSIWVEPSAAPASRSVVLHRTKAPVDAGSRGYEIVLEQGRVAFGLHYMWPGASIKVVSKQPIASATWTHLTVTYDGSSRAAGVGVYINGERVAVETVRDGLFKDVTYASAEPDLAIGYRFRDNGFAGGKVDDLCIFDRELSPLEVSALAGQDRFAEAWKTDAAALNEPQRKGLLAYYVSVVHAPSREARDALKSVREAQNKIVSAVPEAMVMQELTNPRKAYVLLRGAYDAPGEEVTATTPSALPSLPPDLPRNRLGLAKWLVNPANPLMARVTANRLWQMMFGQGLVETSDNFGVQGAPPTHPELLDWLASDFIANGWDVKRSLRQIALSATYRQTSQASPEHAARDPQNHLLSRGPSRRLTAEMLRDQALATSGLLVEKVGGPSVKPYQPPGLWEEIAMGRPVYDQGKGEDLYRRSLYTFWKRTVPPPTMMLFDAAERNVCTVKRQSTSTPLQALALLNDLQLIEAARFIGERMLREGGRERRQQLAWAFALVAGRHADDRELSILEQMYAEQFAVFAEDPAAAEKLNQMGESKGDPSLPAPDRAAATVVAQALLNYDETLMRR